MLQIYCGGGKGKTTAAVGLCVRAAGAGMRVCFAQFMKGGESGEIAPLRALQNVTVMRPEREFGFYKNLSEQDKIELSEIHNSLLFRAFSGGFEMIILDEFNSAYSYSLLDRENAENLILNSDKEIILTGRDPAEIFTRKADYISEIKCVKHPYQKGIPARRGIEF